MLAKKKRKAKTNLDNILKSRGITLLTKVCIMKAMVSQQSGTDVKAGSQRRLSTKELMHLNCGIGEDSWKPLGLQGDQISQSKRKSTLNIHWKD